MVGKIWEDNTEYDKFTQSGLEPLTKITTTTFFMFIGVKSPGEKFS